MRQENKRSRNNMNNMNNICTYNIVQYKPSLPPQKGTHLSSLIIILEIFQLSHIDRKHQFPRNADNPEYNYDQVRVSMSISVMLRRQQQQQRSNRDESSNKKDTREKREKTYLQEQDTTTAAPQHN